jgi:hypothetical protein
MVRKILWCGKVIAVGTREVITLNAYAAQLPVDRFQTSEYEYKTFLKPIKVAIENLNGFTKIWKIRLQFIKETFTRAWRKYERTLKVIVK